MVDEKSREENIEEAKTIFEEFISIVESKRVPWVWQEKRPARTSFVISVMSYFRLLKNEFVFFNPKYLKNAIDDWKYLDEDNHKIDEQIREYEERLKYKEKLGEIGERFVDLSSSKEPVPIYFSIVLEYEPEPYWGSIIKDFRKLLDTLAPIKVGVFHLPSQTTTDRSWMYNDEAREITWVPKVLDGNNPDQLVNEIKTAIELNHLENPSTVYLLMLIHTNLTEKPIDVHGYLFWREKSGEVKEEKILPRSLGS
jgi:hypothetical protein